MPWFSRTYQMNLEEENFPMDSDLSMENVTNGHSVSGLYFLTNHGFAGCRDVPTRSCFPPSQDPDVFRLSLLAISAILAIVTAPFPLLKSSITFHGQKFQAAVALPEQVSRRAVLGR